MENASIFLDEVSKLNIKNGDILVFKHPGIISCEAEKRITTKLKIILEKGGFKNIEVIVLTNGADIGVLTKEESEA